jgi:hypothetical protein
MKKKTIIKKMVKAKHEAKESMKKQSFMGIIKGFLRIA